MKISEKIDQCLRSDKCSANICPLDIEINERTYIPGEDICPFAIKKRKNPQRGFITRAPDDVLKVIAKSNLRMLNKGNQRRWEALNR